MPTTYPPQPQLLKTGDVAQLLGVSRQHVVDLCERGDLRYVLVGKHRRVPRSEVERILGPHQRLTREQEKSLWLHRAMLTLLFTEPEKVLGKARENVQRWKSSHRADGRSARYLSQWESVLDSSLDEIIEVVTSPDEESCELRQNTPFSGVLPDDVRRKVLRSFNEHWRLEHDGLVSA
jgi:excisionase family DNA binding protein